MCKNAHAILRGFLFLKINARHSVTGFRCVFLCEWFLTSRYRPISILGQLQLAKILVQEAWLFQFETLSPQNPTLLPVLPIFKNHFHLEP
jgi:hypothetical protein